VFLLLLFSCFRQQRCTLELGLERDHHR
jgi:hypothetical protein